MGLLYPFSEATTETLSATGSQAISIANNMTILDGVTTIATGNRTIDLTIDDEINAGAKLFLKAKTTATETTIFGTNIDSATITGVAGKTFCQEFTYDGTIFLPTGTAVQID